MTSGGSAARCLAVSDIHSGMLAGELATIAEIKPAGLVTRYSISSMPPQL